MKYRRLGRTNLQVSEIGHGLWGMGGWTGSDDTQSMAALQHAVDLGCTFFDSALAYGMGHSDTLLGKLIAANPNAEIVAASKVPPQNMHWPGLARDQYTDIFPRQYVLDCVDRIRTALGRNQIDVLQLHVWDDSWAASNEWKEMVAELKERQLIAHFGISVNTWEPSNILAALRTGLVDVVQVIYNIFEQAPDDELFAECERLDVGVIARVPLDEGGLSGTLTRETRFPANDFRSQYFGKENLGPTVDHVEKLMPLVPQSMTLPEMALRFVLASPHVSTTIIGMRTADHVDRNIAVSDGVPLDDELLAQLRPHRWDRRVERWSN